MAIKPINPYLQRLISDHVMACWQYIRLHRLLNTSSYFGESKKDEDETVLQL